MKSLHLIYFMGGVTTIVGLCSCRHSDRFEGEHVLVPKRQPAQSFDRLSGGKLHFETFANWSEDLRDYFQDGTITAERQRRKTVLLTTGAFSEEIIVGDGQSLEAVLHEAYGFEGWIGLPQITVITKDAILQSPVRSTDGSWNGDELVTIAKEWRKRMLYPGDIVVIGRDRPYF